MEIFKYEWFTIPLFGITVFFAVYMSADKLFEIFFNKSLDTRSKIFNYMKLLNMPTDEKKIDQMILASSFGVGLLMFLLAWPSVSVGFFLGISFGIAGFQLLPLIFKNLYEKKCQQFVDQLVDGLTILSNGVKSGSNVQQAMSRAVEIMGNPIRSEFSQVLTETQFGSSFEDALNNLATRIPNPDVQMFVTAINILKETGGNLSETLETIVFTIRERQKLEKKISAMTAAGIMQGIIISCIPFVMGGVFFMIDPAYIQPMFSTTYGLIILAVMLGLQIAGGIVIKKIVTIKV